MPEQVLVTDDSTVRIVRLNRPEKKNALTKAFSLLATARPLSAEASKALVNDVADAQIMRAAREIAVLPAAAVALSRGDSDDVVERIDVETMLFKERLQSDKSAAIAAFLSCKI
jgi:enoyl-CoA hydratase/carnithine racemase